MIPKHYCVSLFVALASMTTFPLRLATLPRMVAELPASCTSVKSQAPHRNAECLIAQLKSTSKDPNPTCDPFVDLIFNVPKDFDWQAHGKVMAAYHELKKRGKGIFPILIEHTNDKGYSHSVDEAVLAGLSVGTACFRIIQEQVDVAEIMYKS